MNKLHIITVATDIKYYLPYLVKSVKKHNNELKILGLGTKWEGFNYKFNLIRKELLKLPKDDIVCFVDGYDVVCVKDLNNIIDCFIKIKTREKCKIIVGYDNNSNHIIQKISSFVFTKNINNIVINSGTYIGNVEDLLNMLNKINMIDNKNLSDDQVLLNKYNILYSN